MTGYKRNFQRCDSSMKLITWLVLQNGLIMFLVEAFRDKYRDKVTPIKLGNNWMNSKTFEKMFIIGQYLRK